MLAYALTIFTSAFLLFQLQPLIGKYILPWFGGAPGVWTTCMLFFQVLLLGGYAYAHLISTRFKPRTQAVLHLVLILSALALLPITPDASWKPDGHGNPELRILVLLIACIGLPYFALSSTGPLMQDWFSRTHPGASPFRLYALSNLGSLLALLSFPFFFETHFTRSTQARLWGWGLLAYAISGGYCALKFWRSPPHEPAAAAGNREPAAAAPSTPRQKLLWLLLPACASVLLLAVTNKICQDVAVIPFLWVLPLSLYLLSFIICFDNQRWYVRTPFTIALIAAMWGICWALFHGLETPVMQQIVIYSAGLFVCCMVCHGELYRLKPDPKKLTGFYLMIAAGGALGGVFVAVVAPLIFTGYFELQWGLLLCGLLLLGVHLWEPEPEAQSRRRGRTGTLRLRSLWSAGLAASLAALGIALLVHAYTTSAATVERTRSFYGVLKILKQHYQKRDWDYVTLVHGNTVHGMQFTNPKQAGLPTVYYGENSGVGLALREMSGAHRRIGLVGLGAGTLAAYARAGDFVHVYELNPQVLRLANSRFTFLSNCPANLEITLGDARLSLEKEEPQNFDLLVLDAFTSDAVPVHLLTKEAFSIYERHLNTNGLIAVHVSNKTLNLEPVVIQLARHFHYNFVMIDTPASGEKLEQTGSTKPSLTTPNEDSWKVAPPLPGASTSGENSWNLDPNGMLETSPSEWLMFKAEKPWNISSKWMLLSRGDKILNSPTVMVAARPVQPPAENTPLWTDDFSSLFQILGSEPQPQIDPAFTDAQNRKASDSFRQKDFKGAIARLRFALKKLPRSPALLNNLAFLLAICPDASLRNTPEAVQLAEASCRLTHYHAAADVSALAAVYSEAGRFAEAVKMAQKATALAFVAEDQALLKQNQKLLELYRSARPYHELHPP